MNEDVLKGWLLARAHYQSTGGVPPYPPGYEPPKEPEPKPKKAPEKEG